MSYEIWLTDDIGLRLREIDNFTYLTATRVCNDIGYFRMGLPKFFDTTYIKKDNMIQVWRQPSGGAMSLWRTYFIGGWMYETAGATETMEIFGPDINDILRRRLIAYYSETTNADKAQEADDMMKAYVDENLLAAVDYSGAVVARDVSAHLSNDIDLTFGPVLTRRGSFNRLIELLQAINEASFEAGTEVFFDIVPDVIASTSVDYIFKTYTGQPGINRVPLGVVFDQERGNLEEPKLTFDWSDELNVIYGAGQGEASNRRMQTAEDVARSGASFWARTEGYAEARQEETDNGVLAKAEAMLNKNRPSRKFSGRPVDTAGTRFGVDWNFGDRVTARYQGYEFETIIRAVQLSVTPREGEKITARLEYNDPPAAFMP